MSHFIRPLALAEAVDPGRYEVHFYAPERFVSRLGPKPFATERLPTIRPEQFLDNLARGKPAYSAEVIRGYVRQDRALIASIQPDLVIGDMRLSLSTSAALEHVRCAVMINAYWSPYTKRRSILPTIPLTRIVPPALLGPFYRVTEPLAYLQHTGQVNRVRKELGVPALKPDLRVLYTDGDYVLYPDIPEFVPAENLPGNHRYIGICQLPDAVPEPDWWQRALSDPRTKVFVSLGSSGRLETLPAVLEALSGLPVAVMLSTSGRKMDALPDNVYQADLLPFVATAAICGAVVSHGGSGGVYPAIAAGTPVLGIPSNADMHLSTAVLEESGAGLGVRVEAAKPARLRAALEKLLDEPRYRQAAQSWAKVYAKYDSAALFRQFLDDVLPFHA